MGMIPQDVVVYCFCGHKKIGDLKLISALVRNTEIMLRICTKCKRKREYFCFLHGKIKVVRNKISI